MRHAYSQHEIDNISCSRSLENSKLWTCAACMQPRAAQHKQRRPGKANQAGLKSTWDNPLGSLKRCQYLIKTFSWDYQLWNIKPKTTYGTSEIEWPETQGSSHGGREPLASTEILWSRKGEKECPELKACGPWGRSPTTHQKRTTNRQMDANTADRIPHWTQVQQRLGQPFLFFRCCSCRPLPQP